MQTYASTSYYLDQRPPHLVLQVNLVEEISDAVENVTVHKVCMYICVYTCICVCIFFAKSVCVL